MIQILLWCILAGLIATLLAWKIKNPGIRVAIGIAVATLLGILILSPLVLGGDP